MALATYRFMQARKNRSQAGAVSSAHLEEHSANKEQEDRTGRGTPMVLFYAGQALLL